MTTTNTTTATESNAYAALRLAQIHAETTTKGGRSSALLAASDAERCFNRSDFWGAIMAAERSLGHSVGVFHASHARVRAMPR